MRLQLNYKSICSFLSKTFRKISLFDQQYQIVKVIGVKICKSYVKLSKVLSVKEFLTPRNRFPFVHNVEMFN